METQKVAFGFLLSLILLVACQKQELNTTKDIEQTDTVVLTRDGECDHCMDDCCCFVQLDDDDAASIRICGTTDGMLSCSGSAGACNSLISGGGQAITLSTATPKRIFCMDPGSTIRIVNTSGSDNAGIIVGCGTTVLPISYNIAPQDSVKANTDGSCELSDCTM